MNINHLQCSNKTHVRIKHGIADVNTVSVSQKHTHFKHAVTAYLPMKKHTSPISILKNLRPTFFIAVTAGLESAAYYQQVIYTTTLFGSASVIKKSVEVS